MEDQYNSDKFEVQGFEGKTSDEIINQKSRKNLILAKEKKELAKYHKYISEYVAEERERHMSLLRNKSNLSKHQAE